MKRVFNFAAQAALNIVLSSVLMTTAHTAIAQTPNANVQLSNRFQPLLVELAKTLEFDTQSEKSYQNQTALMKYWVREIANPDLILKRFLSVEAVTRATEDQKAKAISATTELYRTRLFTKLRDLRSLQIDMLRMINEPGYVPASNAYHTYLMGKSEADRIDLISNELKSYGISKDTAQALLKKPLTMEIVDVVTTSTLDKDSGKELPVYQVKVLLAPEITKSWIANRFIPSELSKKGVVSTDTYFVYFSFVEDIEAKDVSKLQLYEMSWAGISEIKLIKSEMSSIKLRTAEEQRLDTASAQIVNVMQRLGGKMTQQNLVEQYGRAKASAQVTQ